MTAGPTGDQLRFVIAGSLRRDFILPISGSPQVDVLGGSLPYAAIGLNLWGGTAGLLARVAEDYPLYWLNQFQSLGFDLSGIVRAPEPMDARQFMVHVDPQTTHYHNPVEHFAERGLAYPEGLLGYQDRRDEKCSRTEVGPDSLQISDVPEAYLEASAVHICPVDYISHIILPSLFRQGLSATVTLSPASCYMAPSYWEEIPPLLSELTAFITEERDIRSLFKGRSADLWEMAEALGRYGPEYIIIRTVSEGYFLYDRVAEKRWIVPQYQVKDVDPTGSSDAFAGAFLIGYRQQYDPLEGSLMGCIADSIVREGSGVFYALDAMPGLIHARLAVLREFVREL